MAILALGAIVGAHSSERPAALMTEVQSARLKSPTPLGLDASAIGTLSSEIAEGQFGLVDRLVVIHCGLRVIDHRYSHDYSAIYGAQAARRGPLNSHLTGPYNYFDASWHPYLRNTELHTLQSVTKSITSVVYGIAITRGDFRASLDTPVLRYFNDSTVRNLDDRKRRMTLRNVLTMSTGLDWNEGLPLDDPDNPAIQMEASDDWVRYVIDRPMAYEPGTAFEYSSGASELLALIFRTETGQDIESYAVQHLFRPLGIKQHYWKRAPRGMPDTEGGLYLRADDLAKIGQLYLNQGLWRGHVLVSSKWVAQSLRPAFDSGSGWRYGYQWWLRPHGEQGNLAFAARGFGGQLLLVEPAERLVVVMSGWNIDENVSVPPDATDILLGMRTSKCPSH